MSAQLTSAVKEEDSIIVSDSKRGDNNKGKKKWLREGLKMN